MKSTNATRRLAKYRAKAAEWDAKFPGSTYADWRTHAKSAFARRYGGAWQSRDDMGRYASQSSRAYYCDTWPEWRDLGDASDVTRLDHTGWYADNFQDGLVKGRVLQLPARNGMPRYVPGTYNTNCDGVTIYPLDIYDDATDCARAADGYAERQAEDEREYDAKERAEMERDELRERIGELRSEARALIRDIKQHKPQGKSICDALRARLHDIRRESREAHKRIELLTDNYWTAVES
jgi:hypothetical protein